MRWYRPFIQGSLAFLAVGATSMVFSCATASEAPFSPTIIESPGFTGAPREPGIFQINSAPAPAQKRQREFMRPEMNDGWPMVANEGPGRAYAPEEGIVSWYGYDHIGRKTATGDWFNPEAMTAAHKTLPFGCVVRVTRLDTNESIIVTINDRGPYIDGRIIDLSRRAAKNLNLLGDGIARCRVDVIEYPLVEKMGPTGNG